MRSESRRSVSPGRLPKSPMRLNSVSLIGIPDILPAWDSSTAGCTAPAARPTWPATRSGSSAPPAGSSSTRTRRRPPARSSRTTTAGSCSPAAPGSRTPACGTSPAASSASRSTRWTRSAASCSRRPGLDVEPTEWYGAFMVPYDGRTVVNLVWRARVTGGTPRAGGRRLRARLVLARRASAARGDRDGRDARPLAGGGGLGRAYASGFDEPETALDRRPSAARRSRRRPERLP